MQDVKPFLLSDNTNNQAKSSSPAQIGLSPAKCVLSRFQTHSEVLGQEAGHELTCIYHPRRLNDLFLTSQNSLSTL